MPEATPKSAFEQAVEKNLEGLKHVSTGIASCCSDCQSAYHQSEMSLQTNLDKGSLSDEGGFSWSACECCGSKLGGNRYAAHGFDNEGGVVHLNVCEDCLCFLANGDVPENWGK